MLLTLYMLVVEKYLALIYLFKGALSPKYNPPFPKPFTEYSTLNVLS